MTPRWKKSDASQIRVSFVCEHTRSSEPHFNDGPGPSIGARRATTHAMSTTPFAAEELLVQATAVAKSDRNLELMDRITILHGYLELTKLDPNNATYRQNVHDAVARLLEAAYECNALHGLICECANSAVA